MPLHELGALRICSIRPVIDPEAQTRRELMAGGWAVSLSNSRSTISGQMVAELKRDPSAPFYLAGLSQRLTYSSYFWYTILGGESNTRSSPAACQGWESPTGRNSLWLGSALGEGQVEM